MRLASCCSVEVRNGGRRSARVRRLLDGAHGERLPSSSSASPRARASSRTTTSPRGCPSGRNPAPGRPGGPRRPQAEPRTSPGRRCRERPSSRPRRSACARARARPRAGSPPTGRARGEPACDLLPQHGRDLVAVEPVEDAPRLLSVDEIPVDLARLLERAHDRLLRDLVEHHPADGHLRLQLLDEVVRDRLPSRSSSVASTSSSASFSFRRNSATIFFLSGSTM